MAKLIYQDLGLDYKMGLGFKMLKINEKDSRGQFWRCGGRYFAPNGFGQKPVAPHSGQEMTYSGIRKAWVRKYFLYARDLQRPTCWRMDSGTPWLTRSEVLPIRKLCVLYLHGLGTSWRRTFFRSSATCGLAYGMPYLLMKRSPGRCGRMERYFSK